ncbi:MAG: glycosyltransferase family 1 protein [Anaeromyxobacter sp.]
MRLGFDAKRVFHNATGLGNYARDVLRILSAHAPGHAYLAYNPRRGRIPFAAAGVEERRPSGAWALVPPAWRQLGLVRDLVADRVEVFHGLSNELPSGLQRSGVAGVVTIHDLIFERYPHLYRPADRRIYRWKFRSAAKRARRVVAISEQTRQDLIERYGIPAERIVVVYQGCNAAFRAEVPPERLAAAAARHGVTPGFVLQVGTVEPRKNLAATVEALAGLPDARLVVVGRETAYARQVQARVAELGLGGRVRFLRGVTTEELAALYRLAAVAVYPSFFEGFGIPIVEALCSGTPVVTTRGGVFPEAGGPGSAYVDPESPAELRAELAAILGDADRRARMRTAGLAHAERFRDEVIARELLAVYAQAMG